MRTFETTSPMLSMFHNSFVITDDAKLRMRHYVSSDQVNDYRQMLDPNKYEDIMYRKNPKVLFNHGNAGFFGSASISEILNYTIGKNIRLYTEKEKQINYLVAETEFRNDNPDAVDIYNMYKNGFMNAWSKFFKPIGKAKWDDEQNMVVYDTWTMREYSAVDLPVDGFAVGSDTFENALSLVKSPMMKNKIMNWSLNNTIAKDFNGSDSKTDLQLLKNEIVELRNSDKPNMNETEINKIVNSALNKYTDSLIPKMKEMMHNSAKKVLNDLTQDVEAIAKTAGEHGASKVILNFMGKDLK